MAPPENSLLDSNLAALPGGLADRIRAAGPLPRSEDGQPTVRRHRSQLSLVLPAGLRSPPPGEGQLVVGVGLGERVQALLASEPGPLRAWDPSPSALYDALCRFDWAADLRSGRLRLGAGLDLAAWLHSEVDLTLRDQHPLLAQLTEWVLGALANRRAPRVVVRDGGLLVREVAQELGRQGRQPWVLGFDGRPEADVRADLEALAPAAVVSINHMVGLPGLCARLGVPLVVWEIDPSTEQLRPEPFPPATTTIATWRARNVPRFRQVGFPRVAHLPLCADTSLRRPVDPQPGAPVTFVGASLCLMAQDHARRARALIDRYLRARGEPQQGERIVHALLTVQRRKLSAWGIPALLERRLPGLQAFLRREGVRDDPALLLGETVGAEWRLNAVAACARHGVEVWGDRGWKQLEGRGVTWRGPAGARDQLTRIYSRDGIHLDISRAYQRDIVTLRVFDVLACGGFVLAEHSDELGALFRPDELATWRTLRDLQAKVRHYLDHPDERREIAARGRARVLRDHRLSQRVTQLLAMSEGQLHQR